MLANVLTVSFLRSWRDPEGVSHSESETVTVDLSDPTDIQLRAVAGLLHRLGAEIRSHDRNRVG